MSNLDERTLASSLQTRDEREKMAYHAKMKEAISLVPRLSSLVPRLFWSSTESSGNAYHMYLLYVNDAARLTSTEHSELYGFSVRCVKD